jgi:uncharacterized protein YkwD
MMNGMDKAAVLATTSAVALLLAAVMAQGVDLPEKGKKEPELFGTTSRRASFESGSTGSEVLLVADDGEQSAQAGGSDGADSIGASGMLEAHNAWRQRYGVPPLKWSPNLARYAQQWADILLREGRFEHRPDSPCGENLAAATGQRFTFDQVVGLWAGERMNYDRATNTCAPGKVCGHFTQLVWGHTREVGCGVARSAGREVWVCNFDPPGNVIGRAPY